MILNVGSNMKNQITKAVTSDSLDWKTDFNHYQLDDPGQPTWLPEAPISSTANLPICSLALRKMLWINVLAETLTWDIGQDIKSQSFMGPISKWRRIVLIYKISVHTYIFVQSQHLVSIQILALINSSSITEIAITIILLFSAYAAIKFQNGLKQ